MCIYAAFCRTRLGKDADFDGAMNGHRPELLLAQQANAGGEGAALESAEDAELG